MAKQAAKSTAKPVELDESALRDVLSALRSNRDLPELPSELQRLLAAHPELSQWADGHQGYALASVLGVVWRRRVRATLGIGQTSSEDWVAALIPVGQYLSPVLEDKIKLRADMAGWQREDVMALLGNAEWVNSWFKESQVTEQVVPFGGNIHPDTYDTWRKKGLQMLLKAIRAEIAEPQIAPWTAPVSASMGAQLRFVPPLPADCVEHSAKQELIDLLTMRAESGEPTCNGVILYGVTGAGKTLLAAAAAHAEAVEQAFEHILWVNASQDKADEWLEDVCNALALDRQWGLRWQDRWQKWAADHRFLLVVDDVVDGSVLKPLLAGLGKQAVVLATTGDADKAQVELLEWMRPEKLKTLRVDGLEPGQARLFVEERLGRALTGKEWEALQEIGERINWLPSALRILATEEDTRELWPGVLESLCAGDIPLDETRERLQQRAWQCLAEQKRQWLQSLAEQMKYGGCFGNMYSAWAWTISNEEAVRRLRQLEKTGMVEVVTKQPFVFGLDGANWRVMSIIYKFLCGSQRQADRLRQLLWELQRMARASWSNKRYILSLPSAPKQFVTLTVAWLLLFTPIKTIGEIALWLLELIIGNRGWRRWWNMWTVALTADEHLRAQWAKSGLAPTEDFGLVYDARAGSAIWVVLVVYVIGVGLNRLPAAYFENGLVLMIIAGLTIGLLILVLYGVAQIAWRVWLAHLCGVETWDLRMILAIARWLGMKEPEQSEG